MRITFLFNSRLKAINYSSIFITECVQFDNYKLVKCTLSSKITYKRYFCTLKFSKFLSKRPMYKKVK